MQHYERSPVQRFRPRLDDLTSFRSLSISQYSIALHHNFSEELFLLVFAASGKCWSAPHALADRVCVPLSTLTDDCV